MLIVGGVWGSEMGGWEVVPLGGMTLVGEAECIDVASNRSGRWRGGEEELCVVEAERTAVRSRVRRVPIVRIVSSGPARSGARCLDGENGGVPIMKAAG